jgi:hypothetical protein
LLSLLSAAAQGILNLIFVTLGWTTCRVKNNLVLSGLKECFFPEFNILTREEEWSGRHGTK